MVLKDGIYKVIFKTDTILKNGYNEWNMEVTLYRIEYERIVITDGIWKDFCIP